MFSFCFLFPFSCFLTLLCLPIFCFLLLTSFSLYLLSPFYYSIFHSSQPLSLPITMVLYPLSICFLFPFETIHFLSFFHSVSYPHFLFMLFLFFTQLSRFLFSHFIFSCTSLSIFSVIFSLHYVFFSSLQYHTTFSSSFRMPLFFFFFRRKETNYS